MGLMQTLKDMFTELLIPLIVIVLIAVVAIFAWYSILGNMSFGNTAEEGVTGAYASDVDYSFASFSNRDGIVYPNINTDPALTSTEISDIMDSVDYVEDCYTCSSCTEEGTCSSCDSCEGITESSRFASCQGCDECEVNDETTNCCMYCNDNQKDTAFCENLKQAIKESYILGKESVVVTFSRNENIDADLVYNAIDQCIAEQITLTRGEGLQEEVCYFNPDIAEKYYVNTIPTTGTIVYDANHPDDIHPICINSIGFGNAYTDNMLFTFVDSIGYKGVQVDTSPWYAWLTLPGAVAAWYIDSNNYVRFAENKPIICKAESFSLTGVEGADDVPDCKTCKDFSSSQELSEIREGEYQVEYLDECSEISDGPCLIFRDTVPLEENDYLEDKDEDDYFMGAMLLTDIGELDDIAINPQFYRYSKFYTFGTSAFEYDVCSFSGINPDGKIKIVYPNPWDESSVGHIKISVGNVITDRQKDCEFNVYICDSSCFANSTDETVVEIYDFLRGFEPTIDVKTNINEDSASSYNYYEFELDREYTTDEIISSIEQGYDYWQANNLPYYYSGIDNVITYGNWLHEGKRPRTINDAYTEIYNGVVIGGWDVQEVSFAGGCTQLEHLALWWTSPGTGFPEEYKSIGYYCPSGKCSGTLKLKIEFVDTIIAGDSSWLQASHVRPYIWFCSD